LLDRFGSRVVLTGVALCLGAVVVLTGATVTDTATLLLALVLTRGLGQGALSVVSTAMIGKWFTRRLGLAMGAYAVLLAVGFIASILGMGAAITAYGWRDAWTGMGVAVAVLAPLGWLLVRSTPEACGLAVDPGPAPAEALSPAASPLTDLTLAAALRTPAFWVFTLGTSLFNLAWSGITLYNQSILEKRGFDQDTFYLVMALLTASGLVSNLLGGWVANRWAIGRLLGFGLVLLAASLLYFPFIGDGLLDQVLLYAVVLGLAGGLITVVHFAIYGSAFGRTHLGKIQGAAQVLSVFFSALGPKVFTQCLDRTGSYDAVFFGLAASAVLFGLAAWLVPLPRRAAPRPELPGGEQPCPCRSSMPLSSFTCR
jgi:MFS family permease